MQLMQVLWQQHLIPFARSSNVSLPREVNVFFGEGSEVVMIAALC